MAVSRQLRTVSVSPAMVQQRAADLVKSDAQILLLRARPEWSHGDAKVGDTTVRVLPGVSQLGVLDILTSLAPGQQAVVLTDRPAEDLGDAVLSRAYKQGVELPDEWQAVPRLFAGAVEATASMGGQIMPPVMGAVAFIMAETLDVPYSEIVKAAVIPALLYYFTAFWMVHLEAGRKGLLGIEWYDQNF